MGNYLAGLSPFRKAMPSLPETLVREIKLIKQINEDYDKLQSDDLYNKLRGKRSPTPSLSEKFYALINYEYAKKRYARNYEDISQWDPGILTSAGARKKDSLGNDKIFVYKQNGYYFRTSKATAEHRSQHRINHSAINTIHINAHPKKELIDKLDEFVSKNFQVIYKVPKKKEAWNQGNDSAVIYFYQTLTEKQKNDIKGLMTDDLIRTDDKMIGKELKKGVFLAQYPSPQSCADLAKRINNLNPKLCNALDKLQPLSVGLFEATKCVVIRYESVVKNK